MAKISELELLAVADGDEIVPVVKAGRTRRMPLQVLSDKATERARVFAQLAQGAETNAKLAEAGADRSKIDARVATTRSEEILTAIQLATAGGPVLVEQRIVANDLGIADLVAAPADTPMGTIVVMVRPGLEGVWQLRPGDYRTRVTSDPFKARYAAMAKQPAAQRAWERIIPGNLFRFSWTGLNQDTIDALPYLKAGCALFDAWSKWELPNHRMPMPTNAHPALTIDKPGVELYGFGERSLIDYTGAYINFTALIQIVNSDTYVHDVFGKLVAPNNSAGNPAFIAVGADRDVGDEPDITPDIKRTRIRDVGFGRCSTGILFGAYSNGKGLPGFKRPYDIDIDNVHGTNNGAAVSAFGGEGVRVGRYDFRYDPTLPAGAPAAKKLGFRVLGTVDMEINKGLVDGYETGIALDAAYFGGNRALNKNISVGATEIRGAIFPIVAIECDDKFSVDGTKIRYPTDFAGALVQPAVRINGNLPLSTVPPGDPLPNTVVGDVSIRNLDSEGTSVAVYAQGAMGKLGVHGSRFVGNRSQSLTSAHRGAVIVTDAFGIPTSVSVTGNDFLMTVAPDQPSMQLQSSSGSIVCTDNVLPEREDVRNSIIVPRGNVVFTDENEQRPFNGFANLGSNRLQPNGALANYLDGTPLPAAAIQTTVLAAPDKTAGVSAVGNLYTKVTATVAYDERVSSVESFAGDFEFVYRLGGIYEDMLVGLDPIANSVAFGSIDWSMSYSLGGSGFGNARPYNGEAAVGAVMAYSGDTIERWRRVGSKLIFSRNGVDLFSALVSPDVPFKLQAIFARQGDAVEVLRFAAI